MGLPTQGYKYFNRDQSFKPKEQSSKKLWNSRHPPVGRECLNWGAMRPFLVHLKSHHVDSCLYVRLLAAHSQHLLSHTSELDGTQPLCLLFSCSVWVLCGAEGRGGARHTDPNSPKCISYDQRMNYSPLGKSVHSSIPASRPVQCKW